MLESLIPFRMRRSWDQAWIDRSVRSVVRTRAIPAADPLTADFEVHLLLRSEDFFVGLVALKSLLRFDLRAAVTVTDDGSLTADQKAILVEHVPGVRLLTRYEAANNSGILNKYPALTALYQSDFHMIAKLLHPILLGRCDQMVVIDSDTVFLQFPSKVVEWARQATINGMYLHDHVQRNADALWLREMFAEIFGQSEETFAFKIGHRFFNAGMLCYRRTDCDLKYAERFLQWRSVHSSRFKHPNASIWLGEWTQEQTAYMCIFEGMTGAVEGLGDDYRIGCKPWRTFHHFLRAGLVTNQAKRILQETILKIS